MAETYQKIAAVPAGFDFRKERVVGFTGERGYDTLWQALLQLVACHDEKEVRIACFYQKERRQDRDYEKLTPEDMVVMDLQGNKVEGRYKPSSDTPTTINSKVAPAPQELQDKHYFRKHGANAYYGQN